MIMFSEHFQVLLDFVLLECYILCITQPKTIIYIIFDETL